MSNYSKVARYKDNIQKPISLLCSSNEQMKIYVFKSNKIYTIYKLKLEISVEIYHIKINKWIGIPYTWLKINIVTILVFTD